MNTKAYLAAIDGIISSTVRAARLTAGQKEFLKDLLNRKKTAELENLPMEEIEKRMAALDSETVDESATT